MAADSVWFVFAGKGVVEMYVVWCVACASCGGSVAFGWLGGVWYVEADSGCSCEVFVC